ncbi:MAG: PQQ-binding-like beta-propeller repeat protein [Phycisphaeraceae bacterium]|nr:PQQ-binding-like beta-propeller repeat protein [Phycisphaeraceae bacterium]
MAELSHHLFSRLGTTVHLQSVGYGRAAIMAAFLMLAGAATFANDQTPPPNEEQLRQWVQDLTSPQFTVREQAQEQLTEAGFRAERVLREVLDSEDVEQQLFATQRVDELETIRKRHALSLRHHFYFNQFDQQGGSFLWRDHDRRIHRRKLVVSPRTQALYVFTPTSVEAKSLSNGQVRWNQAEREEGNHARWDTLSSDFWLVRDRIVFNRFVDWRTSHPAAIMLGDGELKEFRLPAGLNGSIEAVFDHRIILRSLDSSAFIAIHAMTGKKLWTAELVTTTQPNATTPVRIGDTMLVWNFRGIHRFDLRNGLSQGLLAIDRGDLPDPTEEVAWDTHSQQASSHRLVVAGDRLLLLAGGHVEAISIETGRRLWHMEMEPRPRKPELLRDWEFAQLPEPVADRRDDRAPRALVDPRGEWLILHREDRVMCLSLKDGRERWQVMAESVLPLEITDPSLNRAFSRGGFAGDPILAQPWVLLPSQVGFVALEIETGREAWRIATDMAPLHAVLHDRVLYFSTFWSNNYPNTPSKAVSGLVAAKLPPPPSED